MPISTVMNPPIITAVVRVPNTFTPNGDGTNDVWEIKNIGNFPNAAVTVFNRSGQKVFSSLGYGSSWDGTFRHHELPMGTYYYVIDLQEGKRALSGSITIIR